MQFSIPLFFLTLTVTLFLTLFLTLTLTLMTTNANNYKARHRNLDRSKIWYRSPIGGQQFRPFFFCKGNYVLFAFVVVRVRVRVRKTFEIRTIWTD